MRKESGKVTPGLFQDQGDLAPRKRGSRISSSDLINQIVEQIEIGILFGEYKPREHLVQDKLVKRYSVERNIIRAALKKLEEKEVVEHFPNEGCRVKDLKAKNVKDLYQVRFLLEELGARVAASKVTPDIIKQLKSLNEDMEKHLRDNKPKAFVYAHEKFHQLIFETADNSYLSRMIQESRSASASIRNFAYSRYSSSELKNLPFDQHRRMIILLKKREARELGNLSKSHIKSGANYYLKAIFPREPLIE